jgi:hypothetical protein
MKSLIKGACLMLLASVSTGHMEKTYAAEHVTVWEFAYYNNNNDPRVFDYFEQQDCEKVRQQMLSDRHFLDLSKCYSVNKWI